MRFKSYALSVIYLVPVLAVLTPHTGYAAENAAPFLVVGEQLAHPPPEGWKRAWTGGQADGSYIVEFIPATENIDAWRQGYLAIERLEYPGKDVLQRLAERNMKVSDLALYQLTSKAKETCPGQHTAIEHKRYQSSGVSFAVGGGFCDLYGPAAPYGEGSVVAFAEGKNYLFRIQYGWRPQSIQAREDNLPLRIPPKKLQEYLDAIRMSSLCGGPEQPVCKISP
nr:hypothetical protein [uncultured Albidiferax sp.]